MEGGLMKTDSYKHNARFVLFLLTKGDSGVTDVSVRER
jgi:hypothetical protein